jgi:hypothetical protein
MVGWALTLVGAEDGRLESRALRGDFGPVLLGPRLRGVRV